MREAEAGPTAGTGRVQRGAQRLDAGRHPRACEREGRPAHRAEEEHVPGEPGRVSPTGAAQAAVLAAALIGIRLLWFLPTTALARPTRAYPTWPLDREDLRARDRPRTRRRQGGESPSRHGPRGGRVPGRTRRARQREPGGGRPPPPPLRRTPGPGRRSDEHRSTDVAEPPDQQNQQNQGERGQHRPHLHRIDAQESRRDHGRHRADVEVHKVRTRPGHQDMLVTGGQRVGVDRGDDGQDADVCEPSARVGRGRESAEDVH